MKKKLSSQWEFDDLFENAPSIKNENEGDDNEDNSNDKNDAPVEKSEEEELHLPLSVSELTSRIRSALELEYAQIKVKGEVTNLRIQNSGHIYFSIKDSNAQMQCVLFRGQRGVTREYLEDGQEVIVGGGISVYESRGQYQLIVRALEPAGRGALQLAFERLKQKLDKEGLFDQENKKDLPRFITKLGIVTSPSGAAIKDFVHVVNRRFAGLELFIFPSKVQGDGAAQEIANGIEVLNQYSKTIKSLDAILITRGGGSLEDLWAFNEEHLARTIFKSQIPLISAVGHEIDFTISDFVADYRAATPSAAAEIVTEPFVRSQEQLESLNNRKSRIAQQSLQLMRQNLGNLSQRVNRLHPRRNLEQNFQKFDELLLKFQKTAKSELTNKLNRFGSLKLMHSKWNPKLEIQNRRRQLGEVHSKLSKQTIYQLDFLRQRLKLCASQIEILSPKSTLDRGFSIALLEKGTDKSSQKTVLRSSNQAELGDLVEIRLKSGTITSEVKSKVE